MFVSAIEKVDLFTRPIHSIIRNYGTNEASPGSATLFFVNEQACAVTCKHVVELILNAEAIHQNYQKFKNEAAALSKNGEYWQRMALLEAKYGYRSGVMVRIKNNFYNSVVNFSKLTIHLHPVYDLAIIRFENASNHLYAGHAVFLKDSAQAKQGKYLCRLGYPFPEFTNFKYNPTSDDIEWTNIGNPATPRFPIDGIITRHLSDNQGIWGLEMSTPGLRGQSGGPLFDEHGIVYGMQSSTKHLHLGFDLHDITVNVNGVPTTVSNYPFLHVGQCIHVEVIKSFLKQNGVKYYEA
ncbi:MAG: trypsin-like peptidase domain-containing protein [Spirosomataceae bacterium]